MKSDIESDILLVHRVRGQDMSDSAACGHPSDICRRTVCALYTNISQIMPHCELQVNLHLAQMCVISILNEIYQNLMESILFKREKLKCQIKPRKNGMGKAKF